MNIVLCQMDIAWENRRDNFSRVASLLGQNGITKNSLLVLPEMFSTGFSMDTEATREDSPSASEHFVSEIARQHGINILAGIVGPGDGDRPSNDAVLFNTRGDQVLRYSKIQPFTLGGETANYAAGKEVVVAELDGFRLAPFICYDLRFPEIFRKAAAHGAELYCVIANWPCARESHWVTLLHARAIENQAYVVGVNRVGADPHLEYPGRSMVIAPSGEILVDAGRAEGLYECEIDRDELHAYREKLPFLQDMKTLF